MGFLLACLVGYLLGSIDFGILVSKYLFHDDIRAHGSGSAGMTNMLRTFGKKAAALTAVGQLPPGVHRSLDDPYSLHAQLLRKKYRGRLRAAALTVLVLLAAGLAFWFWKEGAPAWLAHWLPAWGK